MQMGHPHTGDFNAMTAVEVVARMSDYIQYFMSIINLPMTKPNAS